jgi:hypothetical protein
MREMTRCLWMLIVLAAISASAQASYHLWTIVQLYSNADGTVQYIELKALAAASNSSGAIPSPAPRAPPRTPSPSRPIFRETRP